MDRPSDLCLVVGDVTSTMACAITAQKLHIPVAHVEGGIRSGDWRMPEEINRLVTDSITNYFFTTSDDANKNLKASGVSDERIFFVGNTMIDTLIKHQDHLIQPKIWLDAALASNNYLVLTLHRPSNVDSVEQLSKLLSVIIENSHNIPIIFPVHPRTAKILEQIELSNDHFHIIPPLSYLEFIYLVRYAKAVITDSGGITEEATVLGIPCMTLRDTTERPETVKIGTNELIGSTPENMIPYLEKLFTGGWKKGGIPELWDGKTSQRIANNLERLLQ